MKDKLFTRVITDFVKSDDSHALVRHLVTDKELLNLADWCYSISSSHGFWEQDWPSSRNMAMIVCEMSEVIEVYRRHPEKISSGSTSFEELFMRRLLSSEELAAGVTSGPSIDPDRLILFTDSIVPVYKSAYDEFLKGTPQEELADVAIYILDLVGSKSLVINSCIGHPDQLSGGDPLLRTTGDLDVARVSPYVCRSTYKAAFDASHPTDCACEFYRILFGMDIPTSIRLGLALRFLEKWMMANSWDFVWHVKAKMLYNTSRGFRNGGKQF